MVENNREVMNNFKKVIHKKNRELQNTPPFFELSGWGDKNRMSPVPVLSGTQRRLFYSLQPFDFFLFKVFDILSVIATMHIFSCPLRTQNNRLLVNYFSVKLRIREFLLYSPEVTSGLQRAYQTQGCSCPDLSGQTEKTVHRICLSQIRQMLPGYQIKSVERRLSP